MPSLFRRARLVEQCARVENCFSRSVARAAGRKVWRRLRRSGCRRQHGCGSNGRANFAVQRFERAQRLLAARHTQVELGFFVQRDGISVVLAIVAALPAILLAHGRHHPSPQRPAFGELHALVDRHCLIMPGSAVVFVRRSGSAGHQGRAVLRRKRRDAGVGQAECGGEKSVEPGALLRRERRRLRQYRQFGWGRIVRHAAILRLLSDRPALGRTRGLRGRN